MDEHKLNAIEAIIGLTFDRDVQLFKETNGTRWSPLEESMWAYQGLKFLTGEKVEEIYDRVSVGRWVSEVAKFQRTR